MLLCVLDSRLRHTSTHDLHTEVDVCSLSFLPKSATSTHDLHTEVDKVPGGTHTYSKNFNSRPPHGGRRINFFQVFSFVYTSTHDLHTEVDDYWCPIVYNIIITSTHDLHTEVDNLAESLLVIILLLQLTTSTRRSTARGSTETFAVWKLQLTTSTRRSTAV